MNGHQYFAGVSARAVSGIEQIMNKTLAITLEHQTIHFSKNDPFKSIQTRSQFTQPTASYALPLAR